MYLIRGDAFGNGFTVSMLNFSVCILFDGPGTFEWSAIFDGTRDIWSITSEIFMSISGMLLIISFWIDDSKLSDISSALIEVCLSWRDPSSFIATVFGSGRSVTKDGAKSESWNTSSLHGQMPAFLNELIIFFWVNARGNATFTIPGRS